MRLINNNMDVVQLIDKKLDHWKKKLIDLSKRNNLVAYRFTKSKSLKIISPSFESALKDLEHEEKIKLLKKKNDSPKERQWLCSEDEETVEKKIYAFYLKAKENFQELGIGTCFVSLGMLKYKDSDDSKISLEAPIFLYPIEVERSGTTSKEYHRFEIDSNSGELQLNPALKEKLFHDYGIELKELENQSPSEYMLSLKKSIAGMKDWSITEEIYADIFNYSKFIMYEDLNANKKIVEESPLIKAYVGDRTALLDEPTDLQRDVFDDTTSVDVLPADSSQKRAIELAKAGVTFVLQGPPGTGKSQTIVNIISALIEQNKKILFVSQKMEALKVVQKRLDEVGLGRYCLNLHRFKGNKNEVVKQLMKELQTSPIIPTSIKREDTSQYLKSQKEINEFYEFLCKKHALWNISVYDIRGELAKLNSIEFLDIPLPTTISLNQKYFSAVLNKVERFDSVFSNLGNITENVYYSYKNNNTTLLVNRFKVSLNQLNDKIEEIVKFLSTLKNEAGVELKLMGDIKIMAELQDEIKSVVIDKDLNYLISQDFEEYVKIINELFVLNKERKDIKENITKDVKDSFLDKFVDHNIEKNFRESSFISRFLKEYKESKKELENYAKRKLNHAQWLYLFDEKKNYEKLNKKIDELIMSNKRKCEVIGKCQDLGHIVSISKYCERLSKLFEISGKLSRQKGYALIQSILSGKNKGSIFEELFSSVKEVEGFFESPFLTSTNELVKLNEKTDSLNKNLKYLNEVLSFKEDFLSLDEEIRKFILKYFEKNISSEFSKSFLKSYYIQVLDEILKNNNKNSPKNLIEKFRNNDLKVRDVYRYEVMSVMEDRKPKDNYSSYGSNEVSILKRENEKKRKLKPTRDLLEQIPNLAFALKPCFMMSPLTVSQYINSKSNHFDVVIFDEASQIMPEDAVPCLIRAKQAIIMGDTQQLPPTSFFLSQEDEDAEEEIEDLPSFLSEATTKFRTKTLDWHYRSKNENLISFSNKFFYDNRLITFPNPKENDSSGLDFILVKKGVYDRGKSRKNVIEANHVLKTYNELKKQYPKKSIGIIAFSIAQGKAIEESFKFAGVPFEEPTSSNIDIDNEYLFIKNIETVQGDERDIIIISVGYGKDSTGKLSYNFGPLNKEGGYKRLNVSITRSRFKTVVLSSILPEELDEDKINVDGVKHLKNYLDFAKNKNINNFIEKKEGLQFDSSFEEAVHDELKREGFNLSCQVGSSGYRVDLAIKHPKKVGEYILGVECDGAQYHSSKYARDRDKVRQKVLEDLGWKIIRIWSDDWLNNKEYEIERIKNRIKEILNGKSNSTKEVDNQFSAIEEKESFKEIDLKKKFKKYQITELPKSRLKIEFDNYGSLNDYNVETKIEEKIIKTLETEGPIEKELLFKRVLNSFGIQKIGTRIRALLEETLSNLKEENKLEIYQRTVTLNPIKSYSEVRVSNEKERPFTLIPKEEIAGAVIDILNNTFSITRGALTTDIARGIYHNNRMGDKIKKKIDEAINYLIKKNLIEDENGKIKLKNK